MENPYVFVYGSLRRGYWNHGLLENPGVEFVGQAKTQKEFALYARSYPWLTHGRPGDPLTQITGEVFRVDKETLDRLDELEGYPEEYDRQTLEVTLDGGCRLSVMVYLLPDISALPTNATLVPSGDFARFSRMV